MAKNYSGARVALIQSNRVWSVLGDVAEAVSVASETERCVYIERRSDLYRWSLAHSGGAYPLLRITARFLGIDYHRLYVGFRTLPDGTAILCDDPEGAKEPADAWSLVELAATVGAVTAADLITSATMTDSNVELKGQVDGHL